MILTKEQAQAVFDAMCALNNVSANDGLHLSFVGSFGRSAVQRFSVIEQASGLIAVSRGPQPAPYEVEHHINQNAFASAYGVK